jgi:hypothetical protein
MKRTKKSLLSEVDELDKLVEQQPLSDHEKERRKASWLRLEHIWRVEEIKT